VAAWGLHGDLKGLCPDIAWAALGLTQCPQIVVGTALVGKDAHHIRPILHPAHGRKDSLQWPWAGVDLVHVQHHQPLVALHMLPLPQGGKGGVSGHGQADRALTNLGLQAVQVEQLGMYLLTAESLQPGSGVVGGVVVNPNLSLRIEVVGERFKVGKYTVKVGCAIASATCEHQALFLKIHGAVCFLCWGVRKPPSSLLMLPA